jgi:hypothetical protein
MTMEEKWRDLALSEMGAAEIRTMPRQRQAIRQITRNIEPPEMKEEFSKKGEVGVGRERRKAYAEDTEVTEKRKAREERMWRWGGRTHPFCKVRKKDGAPGAA